jgi:hypothetical protein
LVIHDLTYSKCSNKDSDDENSNNKQIQETSEKIKKQFEFIDPLLIEKTILTSMRDEPNYILKYDQSNHSFVLIAGTNNSNTNMLRIITCKTKSNRHKCNKSIQLMFYKMIKFLKYEDYDVFITYDRLGE